MNLIRILKNPIAPMSTLASLKRNWVWAVLLLLCVLIAAAAFVAPAKIGKMELRNEAEIAAARISDAVKKQPQTLIGAFAPPELAAHVGSIFRDLGYDHRVLRYEIYDDAGNLAFTHTEPGLQLEREMSEVPLGDDDPKVSIYNRSGATVSHFAVLTIPIRLRDHQDGTLLVYLDQSERAKMLSRYFGLIAAVTMLLLGAGVALPIVLAWTRSREKRRAEERLRYLENYDPLTGFPNRNAFDGLLNTALANMRRKRTHVAVLCVDIGKFNEINDDAEAGDMVLREMGERIRAKLRPGDFAARRSIEEFAVALVDIGNLAEVMAFTDHLVDSLRRPINVADKEFACTASVGVALAPSDGGNAATLLRHAEIALTRAKADGGQRMRCFEPSMDKALQRRRMIEHELRQALEREEFEVVYQSQHDLASGATVGVEALVRWQHPVHGKVAPAHFISVAEETGLIVPLGEWVLRRACSDAVSWTEPLPVAVNLSPAQFRDADMADTVAEVLRQTGLPPQRLELEITESLLISDTDEVFGRLRRLRELGVRIVMDDFGTGYSSFNYLARFAFDKIKIDRQFVRNMTRDPAMLAIVKTIITLGKSLGVTVTAEGVESEEQAAMLREFGCPEAQGFLYGQPGSPDAAGTAKVTPIKRGTSAA
jgi:diguanylate cyclase (GGDEF)-like protein